MCHVFLEQFWCINFFLLYYTVYIQLIYSVTVIVEIMFVCNTKAIHPSVSLAYLETKYLHRKKSDALL